MAFHVACPITCRRICCCTLGAPTPLQTPRAQHAFLQHVLALELLLAAPPLLASGGEQTVDVLVPRLAKDLRPKKKKSIVGQSGCESGEENPLSLSERAVMRKKVTMAAIAIAEAAAIAEQAKKAAEAAKSGATCQVICGLCLSGEAAGSKKAVRMVSCPVCKRLYHRNCLKHWASNRDIFNWASWACASCRICEVCRRTGEPNKLMFCKRCDEAYHAYCQQPQLKQVRKGSFLCPKHVHCHSCGARIPGSGASSRWFLGYTTCDPCGRLFMKRKYCPICLKVYRDSEASPMVCCDTCEYWVHCHCDGISDEKYREFQLDNQLHYKCAACRGDSYRVKDLGDATNELWRRRDVAERDLIAQLQASAGLLSREEYLRLCPSSDDEGRNHPSMHSQYCVKDTTRGHLSKSKAKDGKSLKKYFSSNKKDKAGKSGAINIMKKLKFTIRKADNGMPADSSREGNATDNKGLHKVKYFGPHKNEKMHKEKRKSGKLIKLGAEKTKGSNDGTLTKKEDTDARLGDTIVGSSISGVPKMNMFREDHATTPVKIVKFVNNAKHKRSARVALHFSSKQRGDINKVKTKDFPAAVATEEGTENLRAYQFSDNAEETDAEGPEVHALTSDEEKATVTNSHQNFHIEGNQTVMPTYQQNLGGHSPVHSWGLHTECVKRRRIPSSKYRDMDTSVWRPGKAVKDKDSNATSEKTCNSEGSRLENERTTGEPEPIYTASGIQGLASRLQRERDTRSIDAPAAVSRDESLSAPRKVKMVDFGRGSQHVEESKQVVKAVKDPSSKVSLKLKLKKPVGEGIVDHSGFGRDTQKDDASAIRGHRSKRKRHQVGDTG